MKIRSRSPRHLPGIMRAGILLAGLALAVQVAGPSAVRASGVTVTIDWAFYPSPVTVYAGQSVTWVNHGTVDHWVTPFLGGFVGSGAIPPGGSFTVVFRDVGSITYFDRQYTFMKGTVNVVAATPKPTSTPRPTARPVATPKPTPRPTAAPVARVTPKPTAKPTPKPTNTPVPAVGAATASGQPSGSASSPGSSPVAAGAGSTTNGSAGGSPLDGLVPILGGLVLVTLAFVGGLAYQDRRARRARDSDPAAAVPPPTTYRYAEPTEPAAEPSPPPPSGHEVRSDLGLGARSSASSADMKPRWLRRDATVRGLTREPVDDYPPDDD
jgi:plastocyanin